MEVYRFVELLVYGDIEVVYTESTVDSHARKAKSSLM